MVEIVSATASNFGGHEETKPSRPWVKEVTVPESIKRKYPSKHYVYKVVVKWTNGAETVIYRKYSLFFDFVVKLQELVNKLILENSKVVEADLQLPELPSKVLFGRSQTHQVAEKRRRKVEDFCQQLILLPPEISESKLVLGFFNIWPDDTLLRNHVPSKGDHVISAPVLVSTLSNSPPPLLKSTDNSRSSVISLSQKTEEAAQPMTSKKISTSSLSSLTEAIITHPDEMENLEQYCAIGDYERMDSHQVNLHTGSTVYVIEKHETGWWMVMSEDEQGYAPASYLEPLESSNDDRYLENHTDENEVYEAMESYIPVNEDEVGFKAGERVKVITKSMDGWWEIRCNGQTGLAPAALIRPVTDGATSKNDNFLGEVPDFLYEELNIHHPPPRRNTLYKSIVKKVNHVPPGYMSPRDHPELVGFIDENIYCDPAEESNEEETEHVYKPPHLLGSSEVPKRNEPPQQPTEQSNPKNEYPEAVHCRRGSANAATSQDRDRRGSSTSQSSVESYKPISSVAQTNIQSPGSEGYHSSEIILTVYENFEVATKQSPSGTDVNQSRNGSHSILKSGKKSLPLPKSPVSAKPKPQRPLVSVDPETKNQFNTVITPSSVPSKTELQPGHSVDDYEDIDAEINEHQTSLLPALDDYVDMAVGEHNNTYINPKELKRASSHEELECQSNLNKPASPPRVSTKPSHSQSLSKSSNVDPLPPVFGEDDYIDMEPALNNTANSESNLRLQSPPLTQITPTKPRSSSRPMPPPPYTPKKPDENTASKKKGRLTRAKSMEDILSSERDGPVLPRLHSPPFSQACNEIEAPPLPSRFPRQMVGPTHNPPDDGIGISTKQKSGKTGNFIQTRKPMTQSSHNSEFNWPDSTQSHVPPPLPKTNPTSPPSRQSISPQGKSRHPLKHTMSESTIVKGKVPYVAIFSFTAKTDGCISFGAGDKCELLREAKDSGWWLVQIGDKSGWTPANYWREEKRERSITSSALPQPPPLRKPRSQTIAETNIHSSWESSLQDSLQSSFGSSSFSYSLDEDISSLSRSTEDESLHSLSSPSPVIGSKPITKGKAPPKPKPISGTGSPLNLQRRPDKPNPVQKPQKYTAPNNSHPSNTSPGQKRGSSKHFPAPPPPPLPPANVTRRLIPQEHINDTVGGVVSPNRLGDKSPATSLLENNDEYFMLQDATTDTYFIETAVWFTGKMERVEAEHFLMEHGRQREFLIRERTTKDGYYALSVRYHYNIRHFNIDPTPDGHYAMGTLIFPTIQEIINHYQLNSLFIHDNQHVTLGQAVKKRGKVSGASVKANGE